MAKTIQGQGVLVKRLEQQLASGKFGGVTGDRELLAKLSMLSKQSQVNRMLRPGVREASGEVRKKAKQYCIEETGLLKKSISNKLVTIGGKVVVAIVGPRRGLKQVVQRTRVSGERYTQEADPALYAHLVEFGTKHHRPFPFMRPAWDSVNSKRIIARRTMSELRKAAQNRTGKASADKGAVRALRKAAR